MDEKHIGWVYLWISGACAAFGNSLEPVSVLVLLQTVFLIMGVDSTMKKHMYGQLYPLLKVMAIVLLTQSLGFCIAYAGIFGYPRTTALSVLTTFGAGVLANILYILLSVLPHVLFQLQYPSSFIVQSLVFPTTHTFVTITCIGTFLSTFPAAGNAVLDFEPMKQLASLFGIAAINFLIQYIGTLLGLVLPPILSMASVPDASDRPSSIILTRGKVRKLRYLLWVACSVAVTFIITSFIAQADSVYQVNVSHLVTPTISVSCVFGHDITSGTSDWNTVWNVTTERVLAGDKIVLFSEETLDVTSDEEERSVIAQAQAIAQRGADVSASSPVLIGVSYKKTLDGDDYSTNVFTLVSAESPSESSTVWTYEKANPVPLIESDVRAGPQHLPYAGSPYGKLSGAICFDLDFPNFIGQAGQHQVDLFLQPSWTWNAINYRHFNGDAVRSVENGFTLFRCSSDGESGVVDPRGRVLARQYTGHDPAVVSTFSLPIQKRVTTLYNNGGFIFQYVCIVFSVLYILYAYVPKRYALFYSLKVVRALQLESWLPADEDGDTGSEEGGEGVGASLIVNFGSSTHNYSSTGV